MYRRRDCAGCIVGIGGRRGRRAGAATAEDGQLSGRAGRGRRRCCQSGGKGAGEKIRKAGQHQAVQANAALAASGVETGAGTALRITSGITGDAEEDAYITILNGMNTSARYRAQAQADRISGSNAASAGYINAGSALLQGGAKAYSGWKKANPTTDASSSNLFANMGIR